jgi:hypothetical protein
MNKIIKIGLVLLILGLGLVIAISATSNTHIFGMEDENFTLYEETYDADDLSAIDFDFDNRHVYIYQSEDEDIHLNYYVHEKDDYTKNVSENELTLSISRKWYYNLFSIGIFTNRDNYEVHLYIPSTSTLDTLDIHSSNGKFNLDINYTFANVNLSTSNGDIDVSNISADTLKLTSSNGDINLDNLIINDWISADTSNGKILMNDIVSDQIDADTSNGKIDAKDITSPDITLETSNGKIYISIIGDKEDYRVSLDTSNGDKTYDGLKVESGTINSSGSKYASLDSSNGDIEIEFKD